MESDDNKGSSSSNSTSVKTDSSKLQLAKHTSTGRALALKLRQVVIKEFPGEAEYRRAFSSINGQAAKYAEIGSFIEFAEDMLEISISDSDGEALYYLYDMDGDKKVSCDDFVSFLLGQTTEAIAALRGSNKEVIVDVKLSNNPTQDSDFLRYGYIQIIPDEGRASDFAVSGTFGKGQSMWIWRRKAGTCSGRFKPIIDMVLDSDNTNSTLVLRGYVCVPTQVSSQWLWVKRASTEEEEKDAIVDICVTVGKQKVSTDKIWNSPAGAGWIRVSGPKGQVGNFSKGFLGLQSQDSFVWLRPQRTRSIDGISAGNRLQGGLSEEARAARILEAVRLAIRHHVPFHEVKRLAKLQMEDSPNNNPESLSSKSMLRSDRLFDFAALYHVYDTSGKGNLSSSKLSKMLNDVGVRLDPSDFNRCFYFFNTRLDGYISREEYSNMLMLTQFEIDLLVEKIRSRLLSSASSVTPATTAQDSGLSSKSNKIRDNRTLSDIFRIVNRNSDGILSLDEILDMAATLEYFITEDEGRKILKMIDINGDDRVEEPDFIGFMKKSSEMTQKKAQRLMSISAQLRRWLRGSVPADIANATKQLWDDFRKRNERYSNTKFAGFLSSGDITLLCAANLGIRISPVEARELAVLVAPDRSGKVYDADLTAFINRGCRSFGELIAILDRDVLKPLGDAYRKHREEFKKTGEEKPELADKVDIMIKDIVRQVQGSAVASSQSEKRQSSQDVVLLSQLKAGIELAMRGFQTPENLLPNLEEWASLSCLFGAINAEDDSYGVKVNSFLQGYLNFTIGGLDFTKGQEEMTIEMLCRELQRMILDEALVASKGKKPDYTAAFQLFDTDGQGTISVDEFRTMLSRLQLIDLLPETKIPALLKMFDKTKKGYITFDDFVGFVESNKDLLDKGSKDDDNDDDDEDAIYDIANAKPPSAITRNADCDWILWFLWKECCKVCPKDPESVTTDLESMCIRADKKKQKSITISELWSILYETKIRGNMTRIQFDKSIKYILRDSTGSDDDLVDYDALCRYTVRIGRSHNALIQEQRQLQQKKFEQLTAALKKELLALADAANASVKAGTKSDVPRFEKIFRRLDTDGDGCISVQEFKAGLKRLKIRDVSSWSASMIRRLFSEIDTNKDGLLSVNEFCNFIYDGDKTLAFSLDEPRRRVDVRGTKESSIFAFDDDDDDDDIFSKKKSNTDAELFKKVSDILYDMVPISIESKNRSEDIKSAISKHFQKSDAELKGVVSEEKFKTFCRKSGIVDKLSTQQVKSLIETLTKKVGSNAMIDYDKMLRLLVFSSNRRDAPSVKTDSIIQRLQDAALASAAAGRNFIGLCSLVDPDMTGRISKDEFIHTVKMMGATISSSDVESIQTLLPDDKQGRIDYKELFYIMQHQTPRHGEYDRHPARSLGALPLYSLGSPAITPYARLEASRSLTTPGGLYISSPHSRMGEDTLMRTADRERGDRYGSQERVLQVILDQVKARAADRSRGGSGSSLIRLFEAYDPELSGFVTARAFQVTMEDLGVMLTSADVMTIQSLYGRPEDDKICYEAFCRLINVAPTQSRNNEASLANPRTIQRVRELRAEGRDPRDIFETYDLDRTGMIDVRKFRDVVHRLQLLQSEYQVTRAIDEFASINDRGLICYEDFCKSIESSGDDRLDLGSTRKTKGFVYGSGFDGLRASVRYEEDDADAALSQPNIEKWLKVEASPKQRREFSNVYESLMKFKSAQSDPRGLRDYITDRDEGSEVDYNLTGPKLTDSISFGRSRPPIGASRYSNDRTSWNRESIEDPPSPSRSTRRGHHFDSPNVSRSLTAPRTSPSKVGSIVWGSNTPITQKGKVPKVGDGLWCCAVCLYVENPDTSDTCEVCDSQNYTRRKDYQVKEQCSNCTFLNGQFATECEMCLRPLSSSKSSARKSEW